MRLSWRLSHVHGYLALGMHAAAEAELALVPRDDRDRTEVMTVEVDLAHATDDWPRLRRVAAELVQRDPGNPGWWISWAFATRRALSLAAADQILREAVVRHPDFALIHFNLACYACQLGDIALARDRLRQATLLDPQCAELAKTDDDLKPLRDAP